MIVRRLALVALVADLCFFTISSLRSAESGSAFAADQYSNGLMENTVKSRFLDNLPPDFELPTNDAGELLLREYGAVFVAQNGVMPPKKVFFMNESEVLAFQDAAGSESEKFGGTKIELQKPAMRALEDAVKQAKKTGLTISPRGSDSGRRGYNQTITLWRSRVEPGLVHWVGKGRLKAEQAEKIRRLPIGEQINEVLHLEKEGIFFAKSLDKSIIYSVAPPGSSQHIAMLAYDVKEFDNERVRSILAEHGWFQTVTSDLPHFTYIGVKEAELPGLGLKKVRSNDRDFWVPDLDPSKRIKRKASKAPTDLR